MDLNITKSDVDGLRNIIKNNKPYDEDDPALSMFDGEYDANRMQATTAKRILQHLGLSLTDMNDYGNITD